MASLDEKCQSPEVEDELRRLRVFDLHCDTLDSLCMRDVEPFATQLANTVDGDMVENDLALAAGRMAKAAPGGWTQCYAVWVPDDLSHTPFTPLEFYRHVRDYFRRQTAANSCSLARTEDARSAQTAHAWGSVAAMLTVENGSPIGRDLAVVDELAADGVKMLTLTWNGKNDIASGNDTADGMSDFGREVVRALEDRRIVVDVSHLNDVGFADLLRVATRRDRSWRRTPTAAPCARTRAT